MTSKTSKAQKLQPVRQGQFIYNRMFAWKGAFGLITPELDGSYVSNEFPLFDCVPEEIVPEYLSLWFQQRSIWREVARVSTGTTASRSRWKEGEFERYEIPLPSLESQRRTVSVMAAIDVQLASLQSELATAGSLLASLREAAIGVPTCTLRTAILGLVAGKSPMTDGEVPNPTEPGVLRVSAVGAGVFTASESKRLPANHGLPAHIEVAAGDVLISRANTPERVGAVCRVPQGVRPGLFLCDKTLRLVPDEAVVLPEFLAEALNARAARAHLIGAATGTSKSMYNLSQPKILDTPIPLPPLGEQEESADRLRSARALVNALGIERTRLLAVRSAVLVSLLSGSRTIPQSYDALLHEVA